MGTTRLASPARRSRVGPAPWLALLALLGGGCTLIWPGGAPTGSRGGRLAAPGRELVEYRVAFHCHSRLSHDSEGSFARISAAARAVGLDAVVLDDHYEPGNVARSPRGIFDGVCFVPGVELRWRGGSLLAFGMRRDFDPDTPVRPLVEKFHAEGGVAVAGHVEGIRGWDDTPIDGFEVYNLHAEFTARSRWAILWSFLFLPADAFLERAITRPERQLATWDALLLDGRRLAPLLGCDAHENVRVFGSLGGTIGTYRELFRLFSNHVFAAGLQPDLLADAIRRGRVFGAFDYLGDAAGFTVTYGAPGTDDVERGIPGDVVPYDPEGVLEVDVPAAATIRVIWNARVVAEAEGRRVGTRIPGPGYCRVEVDRGGHLWIVSGPIYLQPTPAQPASARAQDHRREASKIPFEMPIASRYNRALECLHPGDAHDSIPQDLEQDRAAGRKIIGQTARGG